MRGKWGLWAAGTLALGGYGTMVVLDADRGTLRADTTPFTIAAFLTATAGFLVLLWWSERDAKAPRAIAPLWLWGPPVLFRVMLWFTEPTLSDDVYRYLWDGHLLTQGVNPYSYAIAAPELDQYEIVARTLANNPDLSTPYLPVAQLLFAAVAFLGPGSALSMQIVMTAFDIATAVVLYRMLPLAGIPARRVLIYLWNPLIIVEMAHGAHLDAVMVFLTVVSVYLALRAAPDHGSLLSPIALALAALTRPVPLLLVPVLWWRWRWRDRLVMVATMAGLTVPFAFGASGWGISADTYGVGIFGSARVYSQEFRFNAVPSAWLERLVGGSAQGLSVATALLMATLGVGVWWAAWRLSRRQDLNFHVDVAPRSSARRSLRLAVVLIGGYVLLTPVLHPWYLTLLVALLPFLTPPVGRSGHEWLRLVPWSYLCIAVVFSYLTYVDPDDFGELEWVRRLQWFPTLAALMALAAYHAFWYWGIRYSARSDPQEGDIR